MNKPRANDLEEEPMINHTKETVGFGTTETTTKTKQGSQQQGASASTRWMVLLATCFALFGINAVFDSISALQLQIEHKVDITEDQIGTIYALYNFPNTFMVLLGGILFDKIGVRTTTLLFLCLVVFGSIGSAVAMRFKSFYALAVARFVFGLGSESASISYDSIMAIWWDGPNLALGMSIAGSAAQAASIFTYSLLPIISDKVGFYISFTIGSAAMGVLAFAATILFVVVTYRNKLSTVGHRGGERGRGSVRSIRGISSASAYHLGMGSSSYKRIVTSEKGGHGFMERYRFTASRISIGSIPSSIFSEFKKLWEDIKSFSLEYWLVTLLVILYYATIYTFLGFGPQYLHQLYDIDENQVGFIVSIVSWTTIILSPLLGWGLDKYGLRGVALLFSSTGLLLTFIVFKWFSSLSEPRYNEVLLYIVMGLLGFAYSLMTSALWPCITFLVCDSAYGTAFGIMGAGINTMSLILNYVIGQLLSNEQKDTVTYIWMGLSVFSLIVTVMWNVVDYQRGGLSQLPSEVIRMRAEAETEDEEEDYNHQEKQSILEEEDVGGLEDWIDYEDELLREGIHDPQHRSGGRRKKGKRKGIGKHVTYAASLDRLDRPSSSLPTTSSAIINSTDSLPNPRNNIM